MALEKIIISGDPYSRGSQYGEKAKRLIERSIDIYQKLFLKSSGVDWNKAVDLSKKFVREIKNYDETFIEEMKGMAKGAARTFEEILTINIRTEILYGMKQHGEGCTAFCALPEITSGGNTILAQNWDYKPWAAETTILLQINQEKGPDILTVTEAGQLARFGMNSAGQGICNNFIQCEIDGKNMEKGVPTTFIRRKALSQEKYCDVIGTILHTPRSFSANYLVATSEGDSINIEATPETVYVVFPEKGLLVHANHFKGAGPGYYGVMRTGLENSIYRDRRVEKELTKKAGEITIQDAMVALRDHFGFPYSVCRHPDEKKPVQDQWRTNASVVIDLTSRILWIANGPPCQEGYVRCAFDTKK